MEVRINDISKKLSSRYILSHVNFTIGHGQCIGLVGPNGAGKTTLIRILLGLYDSEGMVYFDNIPKEQISVTDEKILFILDASNLFYRLNISQNIEFFLRVYRKDLSNQQRQKEIKNILNRVELLDYADERVKVLSRGMRQRLCIGRTMVTDPKFLILDEPYLGLDVEAQLFLTDYLMTLKEKGTTILISSHDLDHMEKICDGVAFIKNGKILQTCDINNSSETIEDMYKRIIIKG